MFVDTVQPSGLVIVSPAAPFGPLTGDLWMNSGSNSLSIWNGTNWVTVQGGAGSSIIVSPTQPATGVSGDGWFDTINNIFYVHDGTTWLSHDETHNGGRY